MLLQVSKGGRLKHYVTGKIGGKRTLPARGYSVRSKWLLSRNVEPNRRKQSGICYPTMINWFDRRKLFPSA